MKTHRITAALYPILAIAVLACATLPAFSAPVNLHEPMNTDWKQQVVQILHGCGLYEESAFAAQRFAAQAECLKEKSDFLFQTAVNHRTLGREEASIQFCLASVKMSGAFYQQQASNSRTADKSPDR